MENSFQTSFIPKKLITSSSSEKEPKSFFFKIAIFLFVASILISGGLFLYKSYLTTQQDALSSSLANTRDSFEKDTIDELELFNKRTEAVKQLLGKHVVLSPLFSLLGQVTIPSVQYVDFQQQTDQSGFLVNIKGVASDYRSIALQSDIFNGVNSRYFKNVLFSDLTKDKNNNIDFNLKFNVDPSLLSYENNNTLNQIKNISNSTSSNTNTNNVTVTPSDTSLPNNLGNQTQ